MDTDEQCKGKKKNKLTQDGECGHADALCVVSDTVVVAFNTNG